MLLALLRRSSRGSSVPFQNSKFPTNFARCLLSCLSESESATAASLHIPTVPSQKNIAEYNPYNPKLKNPIGSYPSLAYGFSNLGGVRFLGTQAAAEASASDGLTVEKILSSQWPILDESESDWKSHTASIAQSIDLIEKRLQWKKLLVRLELLSTQQDKPDIWDDHVLAGRMSRDQGALMSKMKGVVTFERELLGHIDMIKLAREVGDSELESESLRALLQMRRVSKEKELEALLAKEDDSYSCYMELEPEASRAWTGLRW